MSGKDLFEAMSYVEERFVDEAEYKTLPKRVVSSWIKVASMAACLCLIIFSLYNLHSLLRGETEEIHRESGDGWPEGVVEDKLNQESQEASIQIPAEGAVEEVPSVILRVDEMTEPGFIGTVAELVDTDIFEVGMKLKVVIAEGTRHETADGNPAISAGSTTDYSGSYVMVQFIMYDKENGTIIVNIIREVAPPETTPQKG